MRAKRFLTVFCLAIICLLSCFAMAEEALPTAAPTPAPTAAPVQNPDIVMDVTIGYDGLLSLTRWMPIYVTLENNGPDFEGMLGVNVFLTQTQYNRYEVPLTLPSGATKRVMLPIKPMTAQDMYALELVADGKIIAEKRASAKQLIAPETLTVGVLSDTPQALTYLGQRSNGVDTLRGEVWMTVPLTADTFPLSDDLLAGFSMLVIDGFDLRTLTEAQQAMVSRWLSKGGIAIVSGGSKAAMGYPFFNKWTGLTAGKLEQAEDITPTLIQYAALTATPVEEGLWLNQMPGKSALISQGEQGLVTLTKVGDGAVFTAAFDMAGKPLSAWGAMRSFWPRTLRAATAEQYLRMVTLAEESRYNNDSYRSSEMLQLLTVENTESAVPIFLLLALYLLVVGFGAYLLLKRLDRREWLWVATPAAALVFAGILVLLGNSSDMNQPVALTASRVLLTEQDPQVTTYIGIATPEKSELTVSTNQTQLPTVVDTDSGYYYNNYDSIDKLYRPLSMNQRFQLSDHPSIGFSLTEAWQSRMLCVSSVETDIGPLTARLWVEADGVHGEIVNNTGVALRESIIVTPFGYCVPGDILPGQTATFEMILPDKPVDMYAEGFTLKPNVMYFAMDVTSAMVQGYSDNMYRFQDAALYGKDRSENYKYTDQMRRKRLMIELFEQSMPLYGSTPGYYFYAFNDTLGKVATTVNGTPVSRTAHSAVVGSRMTFEPFGPTGEVMFHQGMVAGEIIVDEGEDKKPRLPTPEDGQSNGNNAYGNNNYFSLTAPVAIRFQLPRYGEYEIEKIAIMGYSYETTPEMYLFNLETGAWEEQLTLSITKTGDKWAPYIDKDGSIYLRFVAAASANRYEGMNMPMLTLKGKVK